MKKDMYLVCTAVEESSIWFADFFDEDAKPSYMLKITNGDTNIGVADIIDATVTDGDVVDYALVPEGSPECIKLHSGAVKRYVVQVRRLDDSRWFNSSYWLDKSKAESCIRWSTNKKTEHRIIEVGGE